MSLSDLCHPTWSPAYHRYFDGPQGCNRHYSRTLGSLEGRLTTCPSLGSPNKSDVLDESQCDVWHLPAVGRSLLSLSPELRGRIYPTPMSTVPFLPAPGTGLTGLNSCTQCSQPRNNGGLQGCSTGKHHVGHHVTQGQQPVPENMIASSPGVTNLSLLNDANHHPDAGNTTQCENNKKHWDCVSSSVRFAMKLFWRDLCLGSMTVRGIHRQRAWDPVSRHGVKKQNKNNLCTRYFS